MPMWYNNETIFDFWKFTTPSQLVYGGIVPFVNDTQIGKCPRIFDKYFHKIHGHYALRQKD